MPSWIASVTPTIAWLPGNAPPTSVAWITPTTKPTRAPPAKTGLISKKSGRCPAPRCGSFIITTSPGSSVSAG